MNLLLSLLTEVPTVTFNSSDVAGAAEAATGAANAVAETATQAAQAAQGGGFGTIGMIIYILALIAIFYFLAIRPQRKRDKEMKAMQSAIQIGDDVMTSSGFYGKVAEINDQVVVVEFGTNRGIRIPVKKTEIIGNKAPNVSAEK